MADFYVYRPVGALNMIANSSFELATTTGWTATGSTCTVPTAAYPATAYRGALSLLMTQSATVYGGVYYTLDLPFNQSYIFSAYIYGWATSVGTPYRIHFANSSGTLVGSATNFTIVAGWQRVQVVYAAPSNATYRLYITKNNSANTGSISVDAVMCEPDSLVIGEATSYVDGDQPGCFWLGGMHQSRSYRPVSTRLGGQRIDFPSDMQAYLVAQSGTGMPPVETAATPLAAIDGSQFQRQIAKDRSIVLSFTIAASGNNPVQSWHAKRAALIDLFKIDASADHGPFMLGYSGGGQDVEIPVVYDSGLDMADGTKDIETVAVRLIAHDPFWYRATQSRTTLGLPTATNGSSALAVRTGAAAYSASVITGNYIGSWVSIATATGGINALAFHPNGTIYFGGTFTQLGSTTVNYVASSQFAGQILSSNTSVLGSSTALNGSVLDITISSAGDVYVCGNFTSANGVATTQYIAKWNGSAWSSITTGGNANGVVRTVFFATDGKLYASGDFTSIGGVAATRIASWNGTTWAALGTGLNVYAKDMLVGNDNQLYMVGGFTNAGGSGCDYFAQWGPLGTGTPSWGLGAGVGSSYQASCLAKAPDGRIYLGLHDIPYWSGVGLVGTVNLGSSAVIESLSISQIDGTIYAGGTGFETYGTAYPDATKDTYLFPDDFAIIRGTTVSPGMFSWAAAGTRAAISPAGDLFIYTTGSPSTTNLVVGSSLLHVNTGSAANTPTFVVYNTAATATMFYGVENITNGDALYLFYLMAPGEYLKIICDPRGPVAVSSVRGNVLSYISPGSDIGGFRIEPGDNHIQLFAPGALAYVFHTDRCWSIDSSGT